MSVWSAEQARQMAKKGASVRWSRYRIRKAAFGDNYAPSGFKPAVLINADFDASFLLRLQEHILGIQDVIDKEASKPKADGRRLRALASALKQLRDMEHNERAVRATAPKSVSSKQPPLPPVLIPPRQLNPQPSSPPEPSSLDEMESYPIEACPEIEI